MSKDPAFLFYPNDYIGGTMGMTFEEKGAYMELLMMQFNRGHMTSHMIGQTIGQLWVNIKDKFKQDDEGLWFNERLDIEKERRKKFTDSRKNNINGKNQYTKNDEKNNGHMDGHLTSHMENEDENENKRKRSPFKIPSIDDVRDYFKSNGYDPDFGETRFHYYNDANWFDSHGNAVLNWKQKMRSVWFKPENKIKSKMMI